MKFDPNNTVSEEVHVAFALADLLATLAAFQALCDEATSEAARTHIKVGAPDEPDDGDAYTGDELANKGLIAWIDTAEHFAATVGYGQTVEAGTLVVHLRRFVRNDEESAPQDSYLWFWDNFAALPTQLSAALSTASCPRVQQGAVSKTPPLRNKVATTSAQGGYHWGNLTVRWGDAVDNQ